jgi:hypothetical protein
MSKLPDVDPGLVHQLEPEQQARMRTARAEAAAADDELCARHTATLDAKVRRCLPPIEVQKYAQLAASIS